MGPDTILVKRETYLASVRDRVLPATNDASPAYAGSHGFQAVEECGWVSSEAIAKEDMLRRIPPKIPKGPRL
jgi:hypothetical protein